jgi:hypothetical protein
MLSRHQYEFPPAVAGNLDRLSPGLVLKLAEFALDASSTHYAFLHARRS